MSIYKVEVDVAHRRPPRADATLFFTIEAENGHTAELIALHMAHIHWMDAERYKEARKTAPEGTRARRKEIIPDRVVMPVRSVVTDWEEGAP